MPISDSFLLATDSDLLIEFSGEYNLNHFTDLSDNPQQKLLYLGSLQTNRILEATSAPGVDSVQISVIDTLPVWTASTTFALGDAVQPVISNTYRYRVVTAGVSDASEPTWPVGGPGSQVIDGTVVWELHAKKHEIEEVTLALTEAELDTNVPGDPLFLDAVIESGVANAVPIYIRFENAVSTVSSTGTVADLGLAMNSVIESEV